MLCELALVPCSGEHLGSHRAGAMGARHLPDGLQSGRICSSLPVASTTLNIAKGDEVRAHVSPTVEHARQSCGWTERSQRRVLRCVNSRLRTATPPMREYV